MIAIVGGSGTLGRHLVPRLLARGETVRIVGRHVGESPASSASQAAALDVTTPRGAAAAVEGARVVVSAITGFASREGVEAIDAHGNVELASAAAEEGVE